MIISDPGQYQPGDFVLFDGAGVTFNILSFLLARFDPSWRKAPRKPWHVGFLTKKLGDWMVGEANGKFGVTETPLKNFKNPYLVFRWFDLPRTPEKIAAFMQVHHGQKYDNFFGYLFTILWFFVRWWPRIIDRRYMCWEFLYAFAAAFEKPVDTIYDYPLITILMDKVDYPGYV
jgi:hypothetical protein